MTSHEVTPKPPRSRGATVVLTCMWLVVVALLVAAGRSLYARTYLARMLHQTITITPDVRLTRKDPRYGVRLVPGHFEIAIEVPEASSPYRFTMDIDDQGYRTTSPDPARHQGQPAVWIFGCSFTWGYPLDNQETYPWLVQAALPDHDVRNYGVHGVGNLRALRQLRELLQDRHLTPPVVAVFGYASFHKTRNVSGAPEGEAPTADALRSHVVDYHAVLDEASLPPLVIDGQELSEENRVTMGIFRELDALCREFGVLPVLAVQHTSGSSDPVVDFAAALGFEVVPMKVDFRKAIYNVLPFDNHPNAAANEIYAEKLIPALQRILADD